MTSDDNFVSGRTHGFQRGVKLGAFVSPGAFSDVGKLQRSQHTKTGRVDEGTAERFRARDSCVCSLLTPA